MGDTVVLNWMQAIGLMNHHAAACRDFRRCEDEWQAVHEMVQREVGTRAQCSGWLTREEPLKTVKAAAPTNKRKRKAVSANEEAEDAKEAEEKEEEDEEKEEEEPQVVHKQSRRSRKQQQVSV